jgi:N-acetylmuramoyl-L-alanine amidase
MNITKKLIRYNFTADANKPEYIVIHDTGNYNVGANAEMHYNYFNSGNRNASAHFFVDDKQTLQLVEIKDKSWHCGDGGNKYGINNGNSIGVEICINKDGNYEATINNTLDLASSLMKTYNIPIERVVRHYDASKKNCPQNMNNNGDWSRWNNFKEGLVKMNMPIDEELKNTLEILASYTDTDGTQMLDKDYWYKRATEDNNIKHLIMKLSRKIITA